MSVGSFNERKERPAFVKFVQETVEDIPESRVLGRYAAKNVDMAHITPPYSKDVFKIEVDHWFETMKQEVANGRMPPEWERQYREQYDYWRKGLELPVNGTPIKGWGILSPAVQETLLRMHILTVEDLAGINDEGLRRIGMGAVDLKHKAQAWLAQLQDKGPLTMQMAGLQKENENLQVQLKTLLEQVELLKQILPKVDAAVEFVEPAAEITASDIIEDEPKGKKGRRSWADVARTHGQDLRAR